MPADDQSCKAPRGPARGLLDDWVLDQVWQDLVLVEEDGQTSVVRARVELVRDVWDMIVGLLEQHCIEGTAHGCDEPCGSAKGGASVPL